MSAFGLVVIWSVLNIGMWFYISAIHVNPIQWMFRLGALIFTYTVIKERLARSCNSFGIIINMLISVVLVATAIGHAKHSDELLLTIAVSVYSYESFTN
jgi:hypothetical protein